MVQVGSAKVWVILKHLFKESCSWEMDTGMTRYDLYNLHDFVSQTLRLSFCFYSWLVKIFYS